MTPDDFAAGMRLTLSGKEALIELPLPAEAYRGGRRPDLADICVFNGNGEPVPFALVPPAAAKPPTESRPLPLFPLPGQGAGNGATVALRVKTDPTGAIVSLATGPGPAAAQPPSAFILDATRLERPLAGIDLQWSEPAGNYLGTVQVAVSDDLEHWTPHGSGAVARLSTGGEAMERHTVEFPAVRAKYCRLVFTPPREVPRLSGASARLAPASAEPHRSRLTLPARPVKEGNGDYLFDTAGNLPVDRLRLVFSEENSFVRVTFSSRPNDQAPWTVRQRGLLYRLRQGETELAAPPLEFPATTDRYWLMHPEKQGGGLGRGTPQLEVGWLPHRLVFVARGPEPFRLAFGSAREGLCDLRDDTLLATLQDRQQGKIRPASATAGPVETLGGAAALRPRISPATWKRWLLWGMLVLGVGMLAGMAYRLYRQMETTDGKG